MKESLGGTFHYGRDDVNVDSGMPNGTKVFTDRAAYIAEEQMRTAPPDKLGHYVLAGRDEQYFRGALPGEIFTNRPLPAGTYRVNYAYLPYPLPVCGATVPEDEMGRLELFVNVSAPAGTLHEALFDPVQDGKAVGAAGGTNSVLEPATFRCQRCVGDDQAHRMGSRGRRSRHGEAESLTPQQYCGPHRRLCRPGRLCAVVPCGCRRAGGCGQRDTDLEGGIAALAEWREADVAGFSSPTRVRGAIWPVALE